MDTEIRLHIGCGTVRKEGYTNVDLREIPGITDMVADAADLPFEKNTVSEIISFHLIEHFDQPRGKKLIKYWYDLLKEGGKLIAETPDLLAMVRRFVKVYEEEGRIRPGYMFGCHNKEGREEICNDNHLWGYTQETLAEVFKEVGFREIKTTEGTDYHSREYGAGFTVRVEGTK